MRLRWPELRPGSGAGASGDCICQLITFGLLKNAFFSMAGPRNERNGEESSLEFEEKRQLFWRVAKNVKQGEMGGKSGRKGRGRRVEFQEKRGRWKTVRERRKGSC